MLATEALAQSQVTNKKLDMTSHGPSPFPKAADCYQSYQSQTIKDKHEDFLRDIVDIVLKDAVFEVFFLFHFLKKTFPSSEIESH